MDIIELEGMVLRVWRLTRCLLLVGRVSDLLLVGRIRCTAGQAYAGLEQWLTLHCHPTLSPRRPCPPGKLAALVAAPRPFVRAPAAAAAACIMTAAVGGGRGGPRPES